MAQVDQDRLIITANYGRGNLRVAMSNRIYLNTLNLDGFDGGGTPGGGTPGGGGGNAPGKPDIPVMGDGKTYLYIKIAAPGRMDVPLYFSQTVANGVTIDWGDGSAPQTLSGTGKVNTTHKYAEIGEYTISLDPAEGCALNLGNASSSNCVLGSTGSSNSVYRNMLQAVEIGNRRTNCSSYAFCMCSSLVSIVIPEGVTSMGLNTFQNCSSLASIVIPGSVLGVGQAQFYGCTSLTSVVISDGVSTIANQAFDGCLSLKCVVIPESVTNINYMAFHKCSSLASIIIPGSVTSIGGRMFQDCSSLASIIIPGSVTSIGDYAFGSCTGIAFYDFSKHTAVPTLSSQFAFSGILSDCKIIVPDALYDEWIAATNWSIFASNIIKKTDWDASQTA